MPTSARNKKRTGGDTCPYDKAGAPIPPRIEPVGDAGPYDPYPRLYNS